MAGVSPVAPGQPGVMPLDLPPLGDDPLNSEEDRRLLERFVLERCRIEALSAADSKVRLEAAREIARILGLGQYAAVDKNSVGPKQNNFFIGRGATAALTDARTRSVEERLNARLAARPSEPTEDAAVADDDVFNPEDGRADDDARSASEDADLVETVVALNSAFGGVE